MERVLEQIDVVYKLVEKYPDDLQLATSSQVGSFFVYISIHSHVIGVQRVG